MKRYILSACAGALAVTATFAIALTAATPSFAADLSRPIYKAPAYVPAYFSWTGFYIGINGGYGWGRADWAFSGVGASTTKTKGGLIGGTAGYNYQVSSYVFGLEGDYDYSAMKGDDLAICGGCITSNRWLATARGRLGYAFDRFLPYITGGAAFGDVKLQAIPGGATESHTKTGYTVGGGLEYAFMGSWSAKAEYLYVDLGKTDCSVATCFVPTEVKYRANILRAGLNYRF